MAPIMPLQKLMNWTPFKLDALGLVTLFGAEEVNQSVGRLVGSRYTTFLPLLGQYLIAGNLFTTSVPGHILYNLTDSFATTSLAGWFSRWMRSQALKTSTSVFSWTVISQGERVRKERKISLIIGSFTLISLIVLTVLMGDWWGVANSIALAVSVGVRWCLVRENINGLDNACEEACKTNTPGRSTQVKLLITLEDGKLVTIYAPHDLVMGGFLKRPIPVHGKLYTWTRRVGWIFFGTHVIALGQCNLITQLLTIVLLISSTWLVANGFGCDDSRIGRSIRVETILDNPQVEDRRMWAYAKLQPTSEEEESLINWHLLPRKINTAWWNEYNGAKEAIKLQRQRSFGSSHATIKIGPVLSASSEIPTAKLKYEV